MPHSEKPWYREPMVWMLISIPGLTVVAALVTIYLAIVTEDGLVEDDYYKSGKEINQLLRRDRQASRLGLQARIVFPKLEGELLVYSTSRIPVQWPDVLVLRLLHVLKSGRDLRFDLRHRGNGEYHGRVPRIQSGKWYIQLETDSWRLLGTKMVPGGLDLRLGADG